MKTIILIVILITSSFTLAMAQVSINTDGSQPDASAMLDVKSSFKGFLPPRMTTEQRNTIESPAEGLLIFNLTTGCIDYFLGGSWKSLGGATEPAFQCGMKMLDPRDGKMYNTVKIGPQCWMAQNLNTGTKINSPGDQSNNMVIEKYCYDNQESNCDLYGGLYKWGEAVQYFNGASNYTAWNPPPVGNVQGICPTGWHLSSTGEWNDLITYFGGQSVAGGSMKETGTSHWTSPNTGANNSSGFSALPGGICDSNGNFGELNSYAYFWSSLETYSSGAWGWYLSNEYEFVVPENYGKTNAFAVRCVQD